MLNAVARSVSEMDPNDDVGANCNLCKEINSDEMVQCDKCDLWFHFKCVGVTSDIENVNWNCHKCSTNEQGHEKTLSLGDATKSIASRRSISSKHLELEILEEHRQLAAKRLQRQQEQQEKNDQEYLTRKLAILFSCEDEPKSISTRSKLRTTNKWVETHKNVPLTQASRDLLDGTNNFQNNRPRSSKSQYDGQREYFDGTNNLQNNRSRSSKSHYNGQDGERVDVSVSNKQLQNHHEHVGLQTLKADYSLTPSQLAARHITSKELPVFSGNAEDWPLFMASYENSTRICGFTDDENLIRLQRSLKGKALEAVRCRLLLPSTVCEAINTLKMLYGRPEMIINSLLQRIRTEPAPKVEKIDTLISFALSVRNLCAVIESTGLFSHLSNPTLIQELVDKMPPQVKLNWAFYQKTVPTVSLDTLGNWLYDVAEAVSSVSTPSTNANLSDSKNGKHNTKDGRGYIHAHTHDTKSSQNARKCLICSVGNHLVQDCKQFKEFDRKQRWKAVKEHKLCRKCLGRHNQFKCASQKQCSKDNCSALHHPLLHKDTSSDEENSHNNMVAHFSRNTKDCRAQSVLFRIVPVKLYGKTISIETFAFLDEGSSLSLLENGIANQLGLVGSPESLCLKWTGETVREERNSRRISLDISGREKGSRKYSMNGVRTVDNLSLPIQSIIKKSLFDKYPHLMGTPMQDYENARPRILIGLDNSKLGLPLKTKQGNWLQPIATKTRLGWEIHGYIDTRNEVEIPKHSFHLCECSSNDTLQRLINDFILLENFGVQKSTEVLESPTEARARKMLQSTTVKIGRRFETGLLWRYNMVSMPNSYNMALKRLACLERKLQQNQALAENLEQQMIDYVAKGYARKLTRKEANVIGPRTWYLPIFAVTNSNKPEKVRIVWDAAAKVDGISLNSMLLKGPDQLSALLGVIHRFRERKVAICGDIKEMFHQIVIRKEDQDSQRFLWRKGKCNDTPDIFVMQVMTFGATCSPSSAQFIKNKNAEEYAELYPQAVTAIKKKHYVDDLLDSVDTISEAITLVQQVKYIHSQAGFEIRNWLSNSSEVLESLKGSGETMKNLNIDADESEKVLGMWWCTTTDTFTYSLKFNCTNRMILIGQKRPTKREVLRVVMSIFDPLGLIAFFIIHGKILIQEIWQSSINWDEQLLETEYERWKYWIQYLPKIEEIRIPRWYGLFNKKQDIQLHIFVDASEKAFAAVAYFRECFTNDVRCALIGAKTKVAPLKPMSIPRLELQAALLGTRLAKTIKKTHTILIQKETYWSDSKTILCWLKSNPRKYKQFVAFRIGEILESTEVKQWRWVPSKLNVADKATKWQKNQNFTECWITGPEFLSQPETQWPIDTTANVHSTNEELKHEYINVNIEHKAALIDVNRFSNWKRLLRTQAYVNRYVGNLKEKIKRRPTVTGPINQYEIKTAENDLYREAQRETYAGEISLLLQNKNLPKDQQITIDKSSSIYKCTPYLDEFGILRIKGRIDAAAVGFDLKRPVILPKEHYLTRLIVHHYHKKYHHHNHETAVNELRQIYSIPNLRTVLNKVRKSCQTCRNESAQPQIPEMADLPLARLSSYTRPFTCVGIDYFGPMLVTIGRRVEKRWGALFTCLTIRAIHIEIAHSLTTDSCILCIRNFIARRGTPTEFFSDNGTNFRGADNELRKTLENVNVDTLEESFTNAGIKWNFNPPSCPHMGGSWERLIRSVKKTLSKVLLTRKPNDELLRSLLIEVENIINSRPLTYLPLETCDHEALTPNHFLLGSSNGAKPLGKFNDSSTTLVQNWKRSQQLTNLFWKRWVMEYLPTITRRTKWFKNIQPIKVNDVVLIVDEKSPRNTWLKGIVIETIIGSNGQVRRAVVRSTDGVHMKPASRLAVLDVKPTSRK